MTKLFIFVLSPLLLLSLACHAAAGPVYCPPGYTYVQPPTYQEQVFREVVQIIQVAQINPAYSSALTTYLYDGNTQAEIMAYLRRLENKVGEVSVKVDTLATRPVNPPSPGPIRETPVMPKAEDSTPVGTGLAVFNNRCAFCHKIGSMNSETKFVLLDKNGDLIPLTPEKKVIIQQRIYASEMPPPKNALGVPKLTAAERLAITMELLK